MKKISIYGGEAFPVYKIHTDHKMYTTIEVEEAIFEKWKMAFETFTQVQKEIIQEMKKQGKEDYIWPNCPWTGFNE